MLGASWKVTTPSGNPNQKLFSPPEHVHRLKRPVHRFGLDHGLLPWSTAGEAERTDQEIRPENLKKNQP